jgi:hypothetical protein
VNIREQRDSHFLRPPSGPVFQLRPTVLAVNAQSRRGQVGVSLNCLLAACLPE